MDYAKLERRMRPGAWSECGFLGEAESLRDVLESDAATLAELRVTAKELADTLGLLIRAPDAIFARRFRDRFGERHGSQPLVLMFRCQSATGQDGNAQAGRDHLPDSLQGIALQDIGVPLRLERHAETALAAVVERFGSLECPVSGGVLVGNRYEVQQTMYLGVQECPWGPRDGQLCGGASNDWRIRDTVRDLELSGSELIVHLIGEHGFFEGPASPYRTDPRALAVLLELGSSG